MLKKRIIFKLYYKDNSFCLSRNFKLQKVGDAEWLFRNLSFEDISNYIDELIILNVDDKNYLDPINKKFQTAIKKLMKKTFIPLTIGGGLRSLGNVSECFKIGADKILLNTSISDKNFVKKCVKKYGSQAIICGIDFKFEKRKYFSYVANGTKKYLEVKDHVKIANSLKFGEIFLTSIDRDGTGFGYDNGIIKNLDIKTPIVLGGGAGKSEHLETLIIDKKISGLMTGNLFNFAGAGLLELRNKLIKKNVNLRKIEDVD
tara:strand:- start:3471 stop:4247 length:777 start_codon:yes stop_codon:yes gene_type:complete